MKKTSAVTPYMRPICLASVVRSRRPRTEPFGGACSGPEKARIGCGWSWGATGGAVSIIVAVAPGIGSCALRNRSSSVLLGTSYAAALGGNSGRRYSPGSGTRIGFAPGPSASVMS
jgi:hypothetical protein